VAVNIDKPGGHDAALRVDQLRALRRMVDKAQNMPVKQQGLPLREMVVLMDLAVDDGFHAGCILSRQSA